MATRVSGWIWKHSPHKGSARLVLLALAECAHPDGSGAYPSVATICEMTKLSERGVRYLLRRLESEHAIRGDKGAGPFGTTVWSIAMSEQGAIFAPLQTAAEGQTDASSGGKTLHRGGARLAPKPGTEPGTEPSATNVAGAQRPPARSAVDGKAVASVVAAVAEAITRHGSPSMEPVVKAALASQTRDLLRGGWEVDEIRSTAVGLALEWEAQRRYSKLMHLAQRQRAKTAEEQQVAHESAKRLERRAAADERYRADMADPARHWYRAGPNACCAACGAPFEVTHAARPTLSDLRPLRLPLLDAAASGVP